VPSLLPGAPQSDPGSHLYPGTRKTHLIPGYVCLSDDHQSPLLGTRLQMPLSQISYSLVVILELSGVLEVQYKEIMMSSINKDN